MNRLQHQALVLLVGIVSAVVSYFRTGVVEAAVLFNVGIVAMIVALILMLFDSFLWKLRYFYPWFVPVPNLNGPWSVKARFRQPRSTEVREDTGKASIEQSNSDFYVRVDWEGGGVSEFIEAAPLVVSGHRTKRCALSPTYKVKDRTGGTVSTRSAFMSFDVPGTLFANAPGAFTMYYSSTDEHHGELDFTK